MGFDVTSYVRKRNERDEDQRAPERKSGGFDVTSYVANKKQEQTRTTLRNIGRNLGEANQRVSAQQRANTLWNGYDYEAEAERRKQAGGYTPVSVGYRAVDTETNRMDAQGVKNWEEILADRRHDEDNYVSSVSDVSSEEEARSAWRKLHPEWYNEDGSPVINIYGTDINVNSERGKDYWDLELKRRDAEREATEAAGYADTLRNGEGNSRAELDPVQGQYQLEQLKQQRDEMKNLGYPAERLKAIDEQIAQLESDLEAIEYSRLLLNYSRLAGDVQSDIAGQQSKIAYYNTDEEYSADKAAYAAAEDALKRREALDPTEAAYQLEQLKAQRDEMFRLYFPDGNSTPAYQDKETAEEYARRRDRIAALDAQIKQLEGDVNYRAEQAYFDVNYNSLANNEDFEKFSRYESTANGKGLERLVGGQIGETGYDDLLYELINGNQDAWYIHNEQVASGTGGEAPDNPQYALDTDKYQVYKQMTPEEVAIFNYLRSTDKQRSVEYLNELEPYLNERNRAAETEWEREYARMHPFLASLSSIAQAPVKGVALVEQGFDLLDDGKIDPNAPYNKLSYLPAADRAEVSHLIERHWGKPGSFTYQTGMSVAENLYEMVLTGGAAGEPFMLAIMGAGAAADGVIAAKDRGLTDAQAFALGIISGAVEAVTEKIGLDAFYDGLLGGKTAIRALLQSALAEGSEEIASTLLDDIADMIITGTDSERMRRIEELKAQGMSDSEAAGQAFVELLKEAGTAGLSGALSGLLMSGGAQALMASYNSIAQSAQNARDARESQQLAEELLSYMYENNPDLMTGSEYAAMPSEAAAAVEGTQIAQPEAVDTTETENAAQPVLEPQTQTEAAAMQAEPVVTPEQRAALERDAMAAMQKAVNNSFGKTGAEAAMSAYDPQSAVNTMDYLREFTSIYNAARNGTALPDHTNVLTKAQQEAAYTSGIADRAEALQTPAEKSTIEVTPAKRAQFEALQAADVQSDDFEAITAPEQIMTFAEAVQAAQGQKGQADFDLEDAQAALDKGEITVYSAGPIRTGSFVTPSRIVAQSMTNGRISSTTVPLDSVAWTDYAGGQYVGTEDINNGGERNGILPDRSERNDGSRAGEQTEGVVGSAGQARSGNESGQETGARSKAEGADSLTVAEEKVTSADLGIKDGRADDEVRVVTDGTSEDYKRTKALAEKLGYKVTLVKGAMNVKGVNHPVRGVIQGKNVWIQMDDPDFTGYQILLHEHAHDLILSGEIDENAVRDRIAELYGGREAIDTVARLYAELHSLSTAEEAWTEIVCDSYADMNVFAKDKGSFAAYYQQMLQDVRSNLNAKANTERGPPQGNKNTAPEGTAHYSLDPRFESEIDTWDGTDIWREFHVGRTSEVLKALGVKDREIRWLSSDLVHTLTKHKDITLGIVKQVPQILEHPVIVLKSQTDPQSLVLFGEVTNDKGDPVLAALKINPKAKDESVIDLNLVSSVYGKDVELQQFLRTSGFLYLEAQNNRAYAWLGMSGLKLPSFPNQQGSIGKVTYSGENVNIQTVPFGEIFGTDDVPIESRVSGDALENARDLITDIKQGRKGKVDRNGHITLYHRTSAANAAKILETGMMNAKEDGIFFSTKENGYNDGYGDTVVKFHIPAEMVELDDDFGDELHFRLPLENGARSKDMSQYLFEVQPETQHLSRSGSVSKISHLQDLEYLAAAESGDEETTGRMVDEAAELAMPDSKVRNKQTGKLRAVYHYTNSQFNEFQHREQSAGSNRTHGDGFYISTDPNEFKSFGRFKMMLFANITNPFEMELTEAQAQQVYDKYFRPFHEDRFHTYEPHVVSKLQTTTQVFDYLKEAAEKNNTTTSAILSELGFDGVHDGIEWVAFNANQLKSADAVTYDDEGNVIPLSKRFNPENEDIRFSSMLDPEALEQQNEQLRKDLQAATAALAKAQSKAAYWEGQTKRSTAPSPDATDINRFARYLVSTNATNLKAKDIAPALTEMAEYIMRGGNAQDELTFTGVKERAVDIAHDILQNYSELQDSTALSDYKEIRKHIRDWGTIRVPGNDLPPDFKDWKAAHRWLRVAVSTGTDIDMVYKDLSTSWPWIFPPDANYGSDQLYAIAEGVRAAEPAYWNPNDEMMAEATEYLANQIIDGLVNGYVDELGETVEMPIRQAKTYADRMQKKLADQKYDAAQKLEEQKAIMQAAVRQARERSDQRLANLKAHYAEVQQNARQRKMESNMRTRLLKIARRLANKKLPTVNRALLNEYIGQLDLVAKNMTGKTREHLQALKDLYDEAVKENPDFKDDEFKAKIERLEKVRIADMTIEEVQDLTDVLLGLEHAFNTAKKELDSADRRDVYQKGMQIVADIEGGHQGNGRFEELKDKFVSNTLSPLRLIRMFTGYVDSDPLYATAKRLNDGQHTADSYVMQSSKKFNQWTGNKEFMKRLTGKDASTITIRGVGDKGQPVEVEITPDMRLSLYLHSKNKQNMKHISSVNGGLTVPDMKLYKQGKISQAYSHSVNVRLTEEEVNSICANMTAQDRALADAIYKYFNETSREALNDVYERLKGYPMRVVENYFPIKSNSAYTKGADDNLVFDGTLEGAGWLKERVVNASNPIMLEDATSVLLRAIQSHGRFVGLSIPISDFNKLFKMSGGLYTEDGKQYGKVDVKKTLGETWGPRAEQHIKKILGDLQSTYSESNSWDDAFSKLRSLYAKATLELNLSVALKQAGSYPTALAVLGWKPLARALADFGKVDLDYIASMTPLQWLRSQGYSTPELGDLKKQGRQLPKALNWIQGMDLLTTRKLWKACEYYMQYNHADLQKGSDEYKTTISELYNRVIEETQPNYTVMQRPELLRSDKGTWKGLMMFRTQLFQNFNIAADAYGNLMAKKRQYMANPTEETQASYSDAKKNAGRATSALIVQAVVIAAVTLGWNALRGKLKRYKDEDKDKITAGSFLKRFGTDFAGNIFSMIPFGGEAFSLVSSAWTGDKWYGFESVDATMLTDIFNAFGTAVTQIGKSLEAAQSGQTAAIHKQVLAWESIAESGAKIFGVPASNVMNLIKAVYGSITKTACGKYYGEYLSMLATTPIEGNKGKYYDLLYNAEKSGHMDQFWEIYNSLVALDAMASEKKSTVENIDAALKQREKKNK